MKSLNKEELSKVNGGVKWGVVGIVAGAIVLIVGIIDGYTNPAKCNN